MASVVFILNMQIKRDAPLSNDELAHLSYKEFKKLNKSLIESEAGSGKPF